MRSWEQLSSSRRNEAPKSATTLVGSKSREKIKVAEINCSEKVSVHFVQKQERQASSFSFSGTKVNVKICQHDANSSFFTDTS